MLDIDGTTKQQNRVGRNDCSISEKHFVGFDLWKWYIKLSSLSPKNQYAEQLL